MSPAAAVSPGTCRVCGCTEDRACPDGCAWADAERTLCTTCYARQAVGMKARELTPCAVCRRPLCEGEAIAFWRVTLERFVVMTGAVRRRAGLDLMIGHALADVMGSDEDLAKRAGEGDRILVCDRCSVEHCLAAVAERVSAAREEEAGT